jgi:hypothetical protein
MRADLTIRKSQALYLRLVSPAREEEVWYPAPHAHQAKHIQEAPMAL